MQRTSITRSLIASAFAVLLVVGLSGQGAPAPGATRAQTAQPDLAVPKDLKPLLLPRQSEMRLVTTRYTLDRATLSGNYLGGGRGGGAAGRADGGAGGGARFSPSRSRPAASRG